MKTLYESILSDIDVSMEAGTANADYLAVMEVINKDYKLYKTYKSTITIIGKAESGKVLINGTGKIEFINKTAKTIANDVFEWNEVSGTFTCFKINKLKDLKGSPKNCSGFNCNQCKGLESLEGAPEKMTIGNSLIGQGFYCRNCSYLTSLEGLPDKIYGDFDCSGCKSLKSLKGLPSYIEGSLYLPKIDSLFDDIGKEIISKIRVKGRPCVVPIK